MVLSNSMDQEQQKRFDEMYTMVRENHSMLRKILRAQRTAQLMRIVYWAIIIISTLSAYYFLLPYLTTLKGVYTGGASSFEDLKDLGSQFNAEELESLFK